MHIPSLMGRPGWWDTVKGWGLGMCQVWPRRAHGTGGLLVCMLAHALAAAARVHASLRTARVHAGA